MLMATATYLMDVIRNSVQISKERIAKKIERRFKRIERACSDIAEYDAECGEARYREIAAARLWYRILKFTGCSRCHGGCLRLCAQPPNAA